MAKENFLTFILLCFSSTVNDIADSSLNDIADGDINLSTVDLLGGLLGTNDLLPPVRIIRNRMTLRNNGHTNKTKIS